MRFKMKLTKLIFPLFVFILLVVFPIAINYYIGKNYGETIRQLESMTSLRVESFFLVTVAVGVTQTLLYIIRNFTNKKDFINLVASIGISLLWFLLISFTLSLGKLEEFGRGSLFIKLPPQGETITFSIDFSFVVLLFALSFILDVLVKTIAFYEERKMAVQ